MSLACTATIRDLATPAIEARIDALGLPRLQARVGPACADLVQRHWAALPPNKRGWRSTGCNEQAADSVRWNPTAEGVVIPTNKVGARQRRFGGHIGPVNKRLLAFPAHEDAAGKTPSQVPGLSFSFIHGPKTVGSLVLKSPQQKRAVVMFWLSEGLDQPPHPEVLPTKEELLARAGEAIMRPFTP
jgi:hypothetical protein